MFKHLSILALSASLCACGGGSTAPSSNNSAAIDSAIANIAQTQPQPAKAFLGAFAAVNGVSVGYVDGSSVDDVAKSVALDVAQHQDKWPSEYRSLLSDAGMAITVFGDVTGTTKFGTVQSDPDVKYVAKMGKGSVIEIVRV